MSPYPYDDLPRKRKDPTYLRHRMVVSAKERGITPTARLFGTLPKTVRKWVQGWEGLEEHSRAPLPRPSASLPKRVTGPSRSSATGPPQAGL